MFSFRGRVWVTYNVFLSIVIVRSQSEIQPLVSVSAESVLQ